MSISFGVTWEQKSQNKRVLKSKVDYLKLNCPVVDVDSANELELPLLVHSSLTALSSSIGINQNISKIVSSQAKSLNSSYICEHLGRFENSTLFNPIYNQKFFNISLENIKRVKEIYQRPLALSLGTHYQVFKSLDNTFSDEINFITSLAKKSDSLISLDLSSLVTSNYNLNRPLDYGISRLLNSSVVEVKVSGIQVSGNGRFWHKCNKTQPTTDELYILKEILSQKNTITNITLDLSAEVSEREFFTTVEKIKRIVRN